MTPIATHHGQQQPRQLTPEEENYNEMFIRVRIIIERCIGILKMRFRCILGERQLRYESRKVSRIFYCCATLHNWLILNNFDVLHDLDEQELQEVIRNEHQMQQAVQLQNVQLPAQQAQQQEAEMRRRHLVNVLHALNNNNNN